LALWWSVFPTAVSAATGHPYNLSVIVFLYHIQDFYLAPDTGEGRLVSQDSNRRGEGNGACALASDRAGALKDCVLDVLQISGVSDRPKPILDPIVARPYAVAEWRRTQREAHLIQDVPGMCCPFMKRQWI